VLLAEATHKANQEEVHRLADLVTSMLPASGVVGVLGLAYKPDTDVIEESQGFLLAQELAERGISTVAYDPAALGATEHVLGNTIRYATSAAGCAQESDVLVITTPWEEFKHIPPHALARRDTPRVVVDCWRILDRQEYEQLVEYVPLGEPIKARGKE
jgi:UDPglucose 6-dehydrogenase